MPSIACLLGREAGLRCLEALTSLKECRIAALATHRTLPRSEDPARRQRPEFALYENAGRSCGAVLMTADSAEENGVLCARLAEVGVDLLVSCGWRYRVPRAVLDRARMGAVNVHRGKLPQYAGAEPVKRALKNGEREVTLTAHVMTEVIDAGETLAERSVPVRWDSARETVEDAAERIKIEILPYYGEVLLAALKKIQQGSAYGRP